MTLVPHPLPYPKGEYNQDYEETMRRIVEQNFEDLYKSIEGLKVFSDADVSLATRRHMFMAAGNGAISPGDENVVSDYDLWMAEQIIQDTYGDAVSITAKKKTLLKFGNVDDLAATTRTTVADLGTSLLNETYAATDLITQLSSSSGSDTGNAYVEGHTVTGTGASSVFTFVTQTATLVGQSTATLGTPLARISRIANLTATPWVGTIYASEAGSLTAGVPTATLIHAVVPIAEQQSFKCATTISNSDYYIITEWGFDVAKKTSASVDFRLEIRLVGGVFRPIVFGSCTQGDSKTIRLSPPVIVPKNADVRVTGLASTTAVETGAWFNGYLASVS